MQPYYLLIRSQVLSHHTINKPHEMLPLSHSPSPDQLPLLCTPLVSTTYHAIYGTCTKTSTPTIAFVLISSVHTDKKGQQNMPHLMHLTLHLCLTFTLALCPMLTLHPMLALHPALALAPHPFAPLPIHIPS